MSTPQVMKKHLTRAELWRIASKSFFSVPFLVVVLFAGFKLFILSGLVVLFMRSFLNLPSGGIAVLALSALILLSISGIVLLVRDCIHVRRLRKTGTVRVVNLWFFTMFFVSLELAIAPSVALRMWAEMQTPDARIVRGKHHLRSPREQLISTLKEVEKRGMWTWVLKQ